jgi:hypothetical protein
MSFLHPRKQRDSRMIPLKANSHMSCRAHAVLLPRPAGSIHTRHAAPVSFSDSVVSFVKDRVVAKNNRTASPTLKRIGMLLITTFVEPRVVAGKSRKQACRPHAISGGPMLIHPCHAMPRCAVALRSSFQNCKVMAWHGRGMACVNQTRQPCVNQIGKTIKTLSGKTWQGNGMVCVN